MKLHPVRSSVLRVVAVVSVLVLSQALPPNPVEASDDPVMPAYDTDGQLLLPEGYDEWIYVGASLGLSYSEGGGGMEMFHHTLMEPTAYRHFKRTGEFREGTMFLLSLHGLGEGELPQRRGRFENELHGIEMAVKDSRTFDDGWAYFGFGGMNGVRDRAQAFESRSCQACHEESGAYDNVFLQFYPVLAAAAPAGSPAFAALESRGDERTAESDGEPADADESVLAVGGLDPVLLTEGREEKGKPEIVETHGTYRYQFVSEPTRARFAEDPERYSIQNETCPVVPGATVSPGIFSVHEGRIYAFATDDCRLDFKENPASFLGGE